MKNMVAEKSLEYSEVFDCNLCDVQTLHSNLFTISDLKKTRKKVSSRVSLEGIGFLTKTLARLGKALDKALSCSKPLDAGKLGFKALPNSQLPQFLGELFREVLSNDGLVLPNANVACVASLRLLLFVNYKLEVPYDPKLESSVVEAFKTAENDLLPYHERFSKIAENFRYANSGSHCTWLSLQQVAGDIPKWQRDVIRFARRDLSDLFSGFESTNIYPKHGPGSVSTGETLEGKYVFRDVPNRLSDVYPVDAYFCASAGHLCDSLKDILSLKGNESFAKVVLVPKDSRGPRLISEEPLAFQWIQQGLKEAIVSLVERHPLTRENVRFTDQEPNRGAALAGSFNGRFATLDLKEASDRVSLGLVQLLFPTHLLEALEATRSLGTRLPDGSLLMLNKFAPMGSALCFPIMALTVWSLLKGMCRYYQHDVFNPEYIYVYGDDVIVPTAIAEHAMVTLESFGLKINRDKSCTQGFFRESCGMDAFKGVCVTPLRVKKLWSSSRCPESYVSWIAYANSFWDKKCYKTYDYIVARLISLYGEIPEAPPGSKDPGACLRVVPDKARPTQFRTNLHLQRREVRVWTVKPVKVQRESSGYSKLLRFFTEANSVYESSRSLTSREETSRSPEGESLLDFAQSDHREAFRVGVYTKRKTSKLVKCWQPI